MGEFCAGGGGVDCGELLMGGNSSFAGGGFADGFVFDELDRLVFLFADLRAEERLIFFEDFETEAGTR